MQVMRAVLALVALAECQPRTIELGRTDAVIDMAADSPPVGCRCRILCPSSTTAECIAIPGSTCGSDGFCVGSVGVCSNATANPCDGVANAVCRASDTSILVCPQ